MSTKTVTLVLAGVILVSPPAASKTHAQLEIPPDQFESPNTERLSQPKATIQSPAGAMRYGDHRSSALFTCERMHHACDLNALASRGALASWLPQLALDSDHEMSHLSSAKLVRLERLPLTAIAAGGQAAERNVVLQFPQVS